MSMPVDTDEMLDKVGPLPPFPTGQSVSEIDRIINGDSNNPPEIEQTPNTVIDLPAGLITRDGDLVQTAIVRELNGYDEEKLARIDILKNSAIYVTELLSLGVENIDGDKPSKDVLRSLLIGDREALVLGIRVATYGNLVPFQLHCSDCDNDSEVEVEIDKDVKITKLADPRERVFEVPLKVGFAKVTLLNGFAQEAFSENIAKKTQPEVNTIMLANSVTEISGKKTGGSEEAVRRLSSGDRQKLIDFIAENQPGPQTREIPVTCATCGAEYPVLLGLGNLFRF